MSEEDHAYCKRHNLKFAHLIRAGVRDHKVNTDHEDAEPTLREMRASRDRMLEHNKNVMGKIAKILQPKEFDKFLKKL